MIRFILSIPALALSDVLRVGSDTARKIGVTIAGSNA